MNDEFGTDDRSAALDVIVDGLIKRINSRKDPVGDIKYLNERLNTECLGNSIIDKAVEIAPEENSLTVKDLCFILSQAPEDYTVVFETTCHTEKLYVNFNSFRDNFDSGYYLENYFDIYIGSYSKASKVSNLLSSLIKCSGKVKVSFFDNINMFELTNYLVNYDEKSITLFLNEK